VGDLCIKKNITCSEHHWEHYSLHYGIQFGQCSYGVNEVLWRRCVWRLRYSEY